MKRTTYIMIGMLVTGVAMVCGLMFYVCLLYTSDAADD